MRITLAGAFAVLAVVLMALPSQAVEIPPKLISGKSPSYPAGPLTNKQEGWVKLKITVTAAGDVSAASVVTSYPQGRFDSVALNAIKDYKFSPKLIDGVPVEEDEGLFKFIFAIDQPRGVSPDAFGEFKGVQKALADRDLPAAEKYLDELDVIANRGKLNLTEIARYYQFAGLAMSAKQNYIEAAEYYDNALRLAEFLDNEKVVDRLHFETIVAFVGLNQYHNAVDYYDSWRKESGMEISEASKAAFEKLRAEGYGRGRQFEIATYKEKMAESKRKMREQRERSKKTQLEAK